MSVHAQKWGIKIWYLANSTSKYVYNFDIYCGRNLDAQARVDGHRGESTVAHEVVTKLAIGLKYLGHCITMDNYFISIPLFIELVLKGIYATEIVRTNCISLPSSLKNTRAFKRMDQRHMELLMHEDCVISCVMWKNKCPVLLFSTHTTPIRSPCEDRDMKPRKRGAIRKQVFTSSILVEYTKHMKGVDVANQLRVSYSSQT